MDSGKDIQKVDYLAKVLDSYLVRTNPFGRSASGERAYRRAERVVAALHILTNHISVAEPSRVHVRRTGIELLSNVLALRDEMRSQSSSVFQVIQSSIRELISLVRILSVSGHVSLQNANIIIEAVDELGTFLIASQRSSLSESILFSKEDLMGAQELARISTGEISLTDSFRKMSDRNETRNESKMSQKDTDRTITSASANRDADIRSQAIIGILKSQGVLGIKDISSNLPEYSEKMIQRELAQLVTSGRIKKTGLKRWSRYELI